MEENTYVQQTLFSKSEGKWHDLSDEEKRIIFRQLCLDDFEFLMRVINMGDLITRIHLEVVVPFLFSDTKYKIFLGHRDLGKTTYILAYIINEILKNPECRILFTSYTIKKAAERVDAVRKILSLNPFLIWAFPDILYKDPLRLTNNTFEAGERPLDWTATSITVKRQITSSDSTLTAGSIMNQETGGHYTLVICDDVSTPENSANDEQRNKVIARFGYFFAMLTGGRKDKKNTFRGVLIVLGTPYHPNDVNMFLSNNLYFDVCKIPCYLTEELAEILGIEYKEKIPSCPERFTVEDFEVRASVMVGGIFECQYLLDPGKTGGVLFQKEDLQQTFKQVPVNCGFGTILDPAGETRTNTGESTILTFAVDRYENIYLLKGNRGNFSPEAIGRLFILHKEWIRNKYKSESVMGVEKAGLQVAFKSIFNLLSEEAFRIEDIKHNNVHWYIRAFPMAVRTKKRRIFFPDPEMYPEEQWWVQALINKLVTTIKSKVKGDKDWFDVFSYIDQLIVTKRLFKLDSDDETEEYDDDVSKDEITGY